MLVEDRKVRHVVEDMLIQMVLIIVDLSKSNSVLEILTAVVVVVVVVRERVVG